MQNKNSSFELAEEFSFGESASINPEFVKYCQAKGLDLKQCVLFAATFKLDSKYGGPVEGLLDYAEEMGLVNSKIIISLLDYNDIDGEENVSLLIPLFDPIKKLEEQSANDKFIGLIYNGLLGDGLMNSRGHRNNPQDYTVITHSKEEKEAFMRVLKNLKLGTPNTEFDVDKASKIILEYYQTAKPAKKLENYLLHGFIVDYTTE